MTKSEKQVFLLIHQRSDTSRRDWLSLSNYQQAIKPWNMLDPAVYSQRHTNFQFLCVKIIFGIIFTAIEVHRSSLWTTWNRSTMQLLLLKEFIKMRYTAA